MELIELLDLDSNLERAKYSALKRHALGVLEHAMALLKEDRLEELGNLLGHSPAGDDMGCDNSFILFVDDWDLGQVITKLKQIILTGKLNEN